MNLFTTHRSFRRGLSLVLSSKFISNVAFCYRRLFVCRSISHQMEMKKTQSDRKHLVCLPRVDLLSKGSFMDSLNSNEFPFFPPGFSFSSFREGSRKATKARKTSGKVSCSYHQQFNRRSNAIEKHSQIRKTETHQLSSEAHIATSELRPL